MHAEDLLATVLAEEIAGFVEEAEPGHCVRVDDVEERYSARLADILTDRLPSAWVNVLRAEPDAQHEIAPERAIELRNRKTKPCLLLVPAGEGHAASSLDNSFQRVPILNVYSAAESALMEDLLDPRMRDLVRRVRRQFARQNREAWAEFLAELRVDPTQKTFGRNLWRIGLIPDLGDDPESRLERNRVAARAISRPSRPAASIDERLTSAGMQEGPWRGPLRRFLEQRGAQLANPPVWAREIGESHSDLSFDHWKLAESSHEDLASLEVEPFTKPDGSVDKVSKLELGADGQLILRVPEDGTAPIVVRWTTDPPRVDAVAKWKLEVLPPEDLRTDESEPLASGLVNGDKRRLTLKVSADEDSLADGSRFVVTVTALGEHGEEIALLSGEGAHADSQEFQVVMGEAPATKARRSAAPSVPEAVLRAALEGMDDLAEDLVSWDLAGQVFGLRLGNRRAVQVRVNETIIRLQRQAVERPSEAHHFVALGDYGSPLGAVEEGLGLTLPNALRRARADFLSELSRGGQRNTAESAEWTEDLRNAARGYLASYKRALDAAEGQSLEHLLMLDTLSLSVRRSNETIRSVVVLPIHPLRLWWIAEHDSVMRSWAQQLIEVTPRSARASRLDAFLVSQVVPANLPFTVIDHDGRVAVYAEELTFGSSLYLVPDAIDSDAAAESVCSVLGLDRVGSTGRATSRMVAERVDAYKSAHDPGGALRILAINPGSGELAAGALTEAPTSTAEDDDQAQDDPRRLEVMCYTDSASYVRPVPALVDLQTKLREHEFARRTSHLTPPLSLSVRPVDQLLEDTTAAHVAMIQDLGSPVTAQGLAADRKPSFRDLLVPLVTRSSSDAGDLVWESVPATGPATGGSEQDLVVVHRSHQRAMGRLVDADSTGAVPTVRVVLDGESQARVNAAHNRADWVIGVDRFVGVDLFETGLPGSYILDYAPDFVEGIGDRLTVTTTHRSEVLRLLEGAMLDLGLLDVENSVGDVLSTLAVVSGRLALRLLGNSTLAREAVSLAALVRHMRLRGELDDLIIVPVDAHPEIFGAAVRDEGVARRCDLLLVRLGQRSFKIECVEVKSRKEAKLPQALADTIVDQLEDTRRLLESRFFSDPPRIDAELQRARLTSLLHYYADRSANHGLISPERIAEVHRYIDRVAETGEVAEISMRGYVISLDGDYGFKRKYGDVPLTVLTAEDLGRLGFTTEALLPAQPRHHVEVARSPVMPRVDAEPTVVEPAEPAPAPDEYATAPTKDASSPEDGGASSPFQDRPASEPIHPADTSASHELDVSANQSPHASGSPREVDVVVGEDKGGAPVTWRVSTKGSPHAFIIGIPGQGKSVTTRKIIRDFSSQGLPSLVFDFHGDMAANPPEGAVVLNAAEGLPFSPFEPDVAKGRPINTTAWEIAEVIGYVAKLGDIQRNHVYKALQAAYGSRGWQGATPGEGVPTMEEFADALEQVETGSAGKNARARLQPFTDFGLFADESEGHFKILDDDRHGWVIDVSQLGLEEVQRFAASFILRRIYREMFAWDQDGTMKLAVVLDEAHRMAKDVTLPKIMKEGRKYGVGVIVASQSADDFHRDVLGNAGTKIVFRTNYPASKAVGGFLRGRSGVDLSQEIEKLDVGVAYVSTPDVAQARRVYMAAE